MQDGLKHVRESTVVQQVKQVVALTGLAIQRLNTGCFTVRDGDKKRFVRTAQKGTCDFEGYDNRGRFVAIECKRPIGWRVSPEQMKRIDDINRKGGVAFITTGGGDCIEKLRAHGCI